MNKSSRHAFVVCVVCALCWVGCNAQWVTDLCINATLANSTEQLGGQGLGAVVSDRNQSLSIASSPELPAAAADDGGPLDEPSPCPPATITVVYNAFIWPENNWRMIISGQVQAIVDSGLARCADVQVALSAPVKHSQWTHEQMGQLLQSGYDLIWELLAPHMHEPLNRLGIDMRHENALEYPGLHMLWMLANRVPPAAASQHLFLYFHTKGMVNHGLLEERGSCEVWLTNQTIKDWRNISEIFLQNATITRVGVYPSVAGFVWWNFWWARASYLRTVPQPWRYLSRRHYFEDWMGRQIDVTSPPGNETGPCLHQRQSHGRGCDTCYSLAPAQSGPGISFTSKEATTMGCPPK